MGDGLIVEERKTYRAPGTRRRYLTEHAAYVAWAKHIIFRHCDCAELNDPRDECPGERCALHERLFPHVYEYDRDGVPIEHPEGPLEDNTRYLRVRDRLVRWLKWRANRG